MHEKMLFLSVVLLFVSSADAGKQSFKQCSLPARLKQEIRGYSPIVSRIIKTALSGSSKGQTWEHLAEFVDTFGNRISGSQNLENAIDYMLNKSMAYGLENVHGEPVTVPHWVR